MHLESFTHVIYRLLNTYKPILVKKTKIAIVFYVIIDYLIKNDIL